MIKISVQFIELLILLTCFCQVIISLTLCPSLLSVGVRCKFGFDECSVKITVVALWIEFPVQIRFSVREQCVKRVVRKKLLNAPWLWRGFSRPPCRRQLLYSTEFDSSQSSFLLQLLHKSPTGGLYILHVGKPLGRKNLRNWLTRWASRYNLERCEWPGSQFPLHYQKKSLLLLLLVGPDCLLFCFVVVVVILSSKLNFRQNISPTSLGGTLFGNDLCRCWFGQWCCWNVPSLSTCTAGPPRVRSGHPLARHPAAWHPSASGARRPLRCNARPGRAAWKSRHLGLYSFLGSSLRNMFWHLATGSLLAGQNLTNFRYCRFQQTSSKLFSCQQIVPPYNSNCHSSHSHGKRAQATSTRCHLACWAAKTRRFGELHGDDCGYFVFENHNEHLSFFVWSPNLPYIHTTDLW